MEEGKKGSYGEWLLKPTGFGGFEWSVDMVARVSVDRLFFQRWLRLFVGQSEAGLAQRRTLDSQSLTGGVLDEFFPDPRWSV